MANADPGFAVHTIDPVAEELIIWLTEQGLRDQGRGALLQGYCERLVDLGLPLWRVHVAQSAFHPRYGGRGFDWVRDEGSTTESYERENDTRENWLRSPLFYMLRMGLTEFHVPLDDTLEPGRFPLLDELRDRGAKDYFASGRAFGDVDEETYSQGYDSPEEAPEGLLISWSTDKPGGFSQAERQIFLETLPFLSLALRSAANRRMAKDLLRIYLGQDAGDRVLSGEIQRGSLRSINAVFGFIDMVGFTSLAERMPGEELIGMLNDYFGLIVSKVEDHGGNVLKFMGDGMLVMFDRQDDDEASVALDALAALQDALNDENAVRSAQGLRVADFSMALHAGDILYGNIGGLDRLDFTAIGPAVNLTARLSGMHHALGQTVIVSDVVAQAAQGTRHDLVSLGRYMIRGVAEPRELFTIYRPDNSL